MVDALVNHPHYGSLWLEDVHIIGNSVIGTVQDDYLHGHWIPATMNFPRTCVRKWSTEHAPDCEIHSLGACDCGGQ